MILFPENLLESLDFALIRNKVSDYCSSNEAKANAAKLQPSADVGAVEKELLCVDEILAWLTANSSFPSTQFEPILQHVTRLKTSGVLLESQAFAEIRSTLKVYEHIHSFVLKQHLRFPEVKARTASTLSLPDVIHLIDKVLDERGVVLSSASRKLAQIRSQLARDRTAAARIFSRVLRKYRDKDLLADFDESVSENRRVLAIQASYKSKVSGIFHSTSNKGNVVFMEPAETVEINNEIAQLLHEEQLEIQRILRKLGSDIKPYSAEMTATHHQLCWLDLVKAKAIFAKNEDCVLPIINRDNKDVELYDAYNSSLQLLNRQKSKLTLPLSLSLNENQKILVISGPNAGGKTIAMKTLGLLSVMLQSGLLIPVHPSSKMPFFSSIMADIGDSQSIENELSTYSSKLVKMRYFLEHSDPHSLLLIDEFGSGSDPELGSTLAQVFLERLNSYGVSGIFTTHYNAIKALAADLPQVENAAMLFNQTNLAPEYRLEIGNPGSSYTYEVAGQSGIPLHLIEEARKKTSTNTIKVDQLLIKLQDDKLQLEKQKQKLSADLAKLNQLDAEHREVVDQLQEKLTKQSRINEENDRLLYWGQRFQKLVDAWLAKTGKKDKKEVVGRFVGLLNQRTAEVKQETNSVKQVKQKKDQLALEKKLSEPIAVGDHVKVLESDLKGVVSEIKKNRYLISIGSNITSLLNRDQFVKYTPRSNRNRRKTKTRNKDKKSKPGSKS